MTSSEARWTRGGRARNQRRGAHPGVVYSNGGGRSAHSDTAARLEPYDTWGAEIPHSISQSCRGPCREVRVAPNGSQRRCRRTLSPARKSLPSSLPRAGRLYSVISAGLSRSRETAKEIVQEAFLRTYRQGESVTTLRAFLFSTARNLAANEYRHQRTVERDVAGQPRGIRSQRRVRVAGVGVDPGRTESAGPGGHRPPAAAMSRGLHLTHLPRVLLQGSGGATGYFGQDR